MGNTITPELEQRLRNDGWDGGPATLPEMAKRYRRWATQYAQEYQMADRGGDNYRRKAMERDRIARWLEEYSAGLNNV